jgi:sulfane dehydrogenase subunit SoxC
MLLVVRKTHPEPGDPAAGNGLLSRRIFLEGALVVGATGTGLSCGYTEPLTVQPWMKVPGPGFAGYGQPSPFESKVVKVFPPPPNPAGVGASRTPLHMLEGMITPSGLHFERSHSGVPEIDPDQHRLVIHGLVKRPLVLRSKRCRAIRCNLASPSSSAAAIARRSTRLRPSPSM